MSQKLQNFLIEKIKNFTSDNYDEMLSYRTLDQVITIAGRQYGLGAITNRPVPFQLTNDNTRIFFKTESQGILIDLKVEKLEDGTFQLFELNMKTFTQLEQEAKLI